jgi:hypothetical protein
MRYRVTFLTNGLHEDLPLPDANGGSYPALFVTLSTDL